MRKHEAEGKGCLEKTHNGPRPGVRATHSANGAGSYAHPWRAFLVLALAIFLTTLDLFVVNVALPAIAVDFPGASLSALSWVLTGYAIAFAAVLVPAGKLGDLYGRRRVFSIGMLLFIAGSALAAAAPSPSILIPARAGQG